MFEYIINTFKRFYSCVVMGEDTTVSPLDYVLVIGIILFICFLLLLTANLFVGLRKGKLPKMMEEDETEKEGKD